jgi:hypothetical protein
MIAIAKRIALFCVLTVSLTVSAFAADAAGKWKADFPTQIGDQHYVYTFVVDGEKLTGTAKNDMGETAIAEGAVKGDDITFVENLNFNSNELKITYTGKISGDEIKFTRKVGDFATEEIVAERQK